MSECASEAGTSAAVTLAKVTPIMHVLTTVPAVADAGFTFMHGVADLLTNSGLMNVAQVGMGAASGGFSAVGIEATAQRLQGDHGSTKRFLAANALRLVSVSAGIAALTCAGGSLIFLSGGIALIAVGAIGIGVSIYREVKYRRDRKLLMDMFLQFDNGQLDVTELVDALLSCERTLTPEQALREFKDYFATQSQKEMLQVAAMPHSDTKEEAVQTALHNRRRRDGVIVDLTQRVVAEKLRREQDAANLEAEQIMRGDIPVKRWWQFWK